MARMKDYYKSEVAPALMEKFGYKSTMQIPKLDKIVVNVGCGEAKDNSKVVDAIVKDISTITGQHPTICRARKSVANFKLREGVTIGVKVTLRGERMYEFLDRLFNVALPRVRDFRGINPNAFDGRGNYNMGLKEQLIFPEIEFDKIDKVRRQRAPQTDGRSLREIRRYYCGKDVNEGQAAETCKVLHQSIQSLQDLRKAACLSPQVRRLPYLLQRACSPGSDPRR